MTASAEPGDSVNSRSAYTSPSVASATVLDHSSEGGGAKGWTTALLQPTGIVGEVGGRLARGVAVVVGGERGHSLDEVLLMAREVVHQLD